VKLLIALLLIATELTIAAFTTIRNNESMKPFDDIEVRRPDLAQSYLALQP